MTTASWSAADLRLLDAAPELEVAVDRLDGSRRPWLPIWVVRAGEDVYVRSWHRRDTGWFGAAVRSGRAAVRVPGLQAVVTLEDVADARPEVTSEVDAAYRSKYAGGAASMVTTAAAATTLRLRRA